MMKHVQASALAVLMSLSLAGCTTTNTGSPEPNTNPSTSTNTASNNTTSSTKTTTHLSSTAGNANLSTVKSSLYNGPLPGNLMIADRGNSRILIVSPDKKILWSMSMGKPGAGEHSKGADDTFFTPDHKHIIINEEDNHLVGVIDMASKKMVWSYGHPGVPGRAPGYLNTPDDAYMLPNGDVSVADIKNMRILFVNPKGQIVKQYGNGAWNHTPPLSFASPNGDTPLPDGGTLVTEINGSFADRLDKNGKLMYSVHFKDVTYPSDTQLLPNGNLLTVDYSTPGRVEEVTPKGDVVWEYFQKGGSGMLSCPSLAFRLPNGNIAVNDDKRDRVLIIDPKTNKIVWQYGHTDEPGTASGYLDTPDGMDLALPSWVLPGMSS